METFYVVGNRFPVPDGVGRPHLQLRESRLSGLPRPSAGRRRTHGAGPPEQAHRSKPDARCWPTSVAVAHPVSQTQRVVIGRPQLVGYFCLLPHPDDEEADC